LTARSDSRGRIPNRRIASSRCCSAQPQEIVSSRSCGSHTGSARVRSASNTMRSAITRNFQGCVLWLLGASTAYRTHAESFLSSGDARGKLVAATLHGVPAGGASLRGSQIFRSSSPLLRASCPVAGAPSLDAASRSIDHRRELWSGAECSVVVRWVTLRRLGNTILPLTLALALALALPGPVSAL
jgi:hypothetical protein